MLEGIIYLYIPFFDKLFIYHTFLIALKISKFQKIQEHKRHIEVPLSFYFLHFDIMLSKLQDNVEGSQKSHKRQTKKEY